MYDWTLRIERRDYILENAIKNYEDVDSWKTIMFLYNAALKEVGTKLETLSFKNWNTNTLSPACTFFG